MTRLDRVTITGADDAVDPAALLALSQEFPFVEWGILFVAINQRIPRFPSYDWVAQLAALWTVGPMCAAHLSGRFVDEVLHAQPTWWLSVPGEIRTTLFGRVQLNTGILHRGGFSPGLALPGRRPEGPLILQCTRMNAAWVQGFCRPNSQFSPLFDVSGGLEVLPETWPPVWPNVYCGYAGGLSPDTLPEQWPRIEAAAPNARIWLDMEGGVRTADAFDLTKVRAVLEYLALRVTSGA